MTILVSETAQVEFVYRFLHAMLAKLEISNSRSGLDSIEARIFEIVLALHILRDNS